MTKNGNEGLPADDIIDLGLLKNNTHILTGDIDEVSIDSAIRWIIYENLEHHSQKTLTLYINSPGGNLADAFALIDIMRNSKHTIRTIGMGNVMSAAFLIFAAGTRGERYIAKNTSILCHQFSEDVEGKFHDIKAQMRESENMNKRMVELLKECTDLSTKIIRTKLLPPSDVWLSVDETVKLGIADHIL
ncbi:MAG: ATP-dependent Clp protease proteolytic subunit [Flavobacteriales bacterium]